MRIDSSVEGHITLNRRFSNIQNATPALHQMTIKLLNKEMGITGPQSGALPSSLPIIKPNQNPENNGKMTND